MRDLAQVRSPQLRRFTQATCSPPAAAPQRNRSKRKGLATKSTIGRCDGTAAAMLPTG
jgi:hypothetical protein